MIWDTPEQIQEKMDLAKRLIQEHGESLTWDLAEQAVLADTLELGSWYGLKRASITPCQALRKLKGLEEDAVKTEDSKYPQPTMEQLQKEIDNRRPITPANHYRNGRTGKLYPSASEAEAAVRTLLLYIGEDPIRPGLRDTPGRVVKALREMTEGYQKDPKVILSKVFEQTYDEMVIVRGITFDSLCEHHLLHFSGTVDIGYIPSKDGVVGLSKLARLVDCFARRLQIQEHLTTQIAHAIQEHLEPSGVAVVVRATHSCMSCRGVRKSNSEMVTSCMLGVLRDMPAARAEFLSLCSI